MYCRKDLLDAKKAFAEAAKQPSKITIEESEEEEDDDVQFIHETYPDQKAKVTMLKLHTDIK